MAGHAQRGAGTPDLRGRLLALAHAFWPYALSFAGLYALGLALGVLARIERKTDPDSVDFRVLSWVVGHRDAWPGLTRFFRVLSRLGDPDVATAGVVLIGLVLLTLHVRGTGVARREIVLWVGVALASRLLTAALKAWFLRERPATIHRLVEESSPSFPSGHSLSSAAILTVAAVLLCRWLVGVPAWARAALVAALLGLSASISTSRVWLGVHYPTDILGGFLLGLGLALAACAIRFGWWRRFVRSV